MDGDLFTLRFKSGSKGVTSGFVRATSLQQAARVGQAYCNQHINYTFISVERTVLADESILDEPARDEKHPDMIDESEFPMKVARRAKPDEPPTLTPEEMAELRKLDAQEEAEDDAADRLDAEREAAEDARVKGRKPSEAVAAGGPPPLPSMVGGKSKNK